MPEPALLLLFAPNPVWTWLHRLGGVGLILLGLADNSIIPLPGSMDAFTIILSAGHKDYWPYYAFMATLGAVLGGYLTYRIADKGEKATLERKFGKKRAEKVYRKFEKRGFSTVMVGAMIPPPFPIVPVLMAAGALHYPRKKFIGALAAGRGIRFTVDGILGAVYGGAILGFFSQYYKPVLYGLIALAVLGAVATLVYFKWWRPRHQKPSRRPARERASKPAA